MNKRAGLKWETEPPTSSDKLIEKSNIEYFDLFLLQKGLNYELKWCDQSTAFVRRPSSGAIYDDPIRPTQTMDIYNKNIGSVESMQTLPAN